MNTLRKFAAIAAASAALGAVTLGAAPAAAQNAQDQIINGWRNTNPMTQRQDSRDRDWGDRDNGPRYGYGPAYGYGPDYNDPDVASGAMTVAICPDGYRLDGSGRLCWPD